MDFEKLNDTLYHKAGHCRFTKKPTDFDKGYLKISNWVNELCWYYINQRKALEEQMDRDFKHLLEVQRQKIDSLAPSEYKEGLMKALEDVL